MLDEKATTENVRHFLEQHKRRVLRAGKNISTLQSSNFDGLPRTPSRLNTADNRIVERANAEYEIKKTYEAVNCLDPISQTIIKRLWLDRDTKRNWEVSNELNYGRTRYGELKRKALLMFSEAYMVEDLRVPAGT